MEPTTTTTTDDFDLEAAIAHDLRVLNAELYTDETRRATESFLLREVADHAWRHKVRVGLPRFWWPTEAQCLALAPLDHGADSARRDFLLLQIDAGALLWANEAEARRALRKLELDAEVVPVLRDILARADSASPADALARAG